MSKPAPILGSVVMVTGAGGGIGRAGLRKIAQICAMIPKRSGRC